MRDKLRRKSPMGKLENFRFGNSGRANVAGSYVYIRQDSYFLLAKLEEDRLILNRALREEAGEISQIYSAFRHYLAKNRIRFKEYSFN